MSDTINTRDTWEQLMRKIDAAKAGGAVDLSSDEDLAIGVMNLVSLEEHFFFTAQKIKKPEYFDLLSEVREARKSLLAKMIPKTEGETWCASKHLLAASMRFYEVGTKLLAAKKKEEAQELFDRAYQMFSLFWGLRLKLLSLPELKSDAAADKPWSVSDIVGKLANCCDE